MTQERKDRPIIFSAPMIEAILREIENPGTGKTETRRILKPQPSGGIEGCYHRPDGLWIWTVCGGVGISNPFPIRFAPGDRLWVRETHWQWGFWDYQPCRDQKWKFFPAKSSSRWFMYEGDQVDGYEPPKRSHGRLAWYRRPSIYMPLEASRLTLIVESVKVERLQDIDDKAARREGIMGQKIVVEGEECDGWTWGADQRGWNDTARQAFEHLWCEINGVASWEANPFVVAIRFKPYLVNVDDMAECIACAVPFKDGDKYYPDIGGGSLHAACCGPERECYVDLETGEPIKDGEPVPEPRVWSYA